jgi:3-hydroxyacyl-[acyl-carrier-protein] dehydratase
MIIEDLYTYEVREHRENTIEAVIRVNENSVVYKGHFPDLPVTPGVIQVLMIKEILENELHIQLRLSSAGNIKFTAMHAPAGARMIEARISYVKEGNNYKTNGLLFQGDNIYLRFRGEFDCRI